MSRLLAIAMSTSLAACASPPAPVTAPPTPPAAATEEATATPAPEPVDTSPPPEIDDSVPEDDLATTDARVAFLATQCRDHDPSACEHLGARYLKTDPQRAVRYFRRGCRQDDIPSCHGWGWMIADQIEGGPPRDLPKAMEIFERACDAGYRSSCTMLGLQYYHGRIDGIRDMARSVPYFEKACAAGEREAACFNLAFALNEGHGDGGRPRAIELFERSCEAKVAMGCANAANLRIHEGAAPTAPPVVALHRRGCNLGHVPSCEHAKANAGGFQPHATVARGERSPLPSVEGWDEARVVAVGGADALGCEPKMVREWLRVSCREKNARGGTPSSVVVDAGGQYDTYTYANLGVASIVTAMIPGTDLRVTFVWSDGSRRVLHARWDRGAPRPVEMASFLDP